VTLAHTDAVKMTKNRSASDRKQKQRKRLNLDPWEENRTRKSWEQSQELSRRILKTTGPHPSRVGKRGEVPLSVSLQANRRNTEVDSGIADDMPRALARWRARLQVGVEPTIEEIFSKEH